MMCQKTAAKETFRPFFCCFLVTHLTFPDVIQILRNVLMKSEDSTFKHPVCLRSRYNGKIWSRLEVGPSYPRLQNSRIFCERKRRCRSIFERKVWSECKNGEGEWGETLKITTVSHPYIKFVQNYPFFQQREFPLV